MDYTRYQTLNLTRRGVDGSVLDIQISAENGKLPTAERIGLVSLAVEDGDLLPRAYERRAPKF